MTLDVNKIERFFQIIKDNHEKLNLIKKEGKQNFIKNYKNYNTSLRLLQISIESMINIANHIIARKSLGKPQDYVNAFQILYKNKILKQKNLKRYIQMIKFRNMIVHIYWEIDLNYVYELLENNLDDFLKFIKEISKIL